MVSDLWFGAPLSAPDGNIQCPGNRITHYEGIDRDDSSFDRELDCAFDGFVRVSEWSCERY
ncbi:MAG: hypothetical protein R3305_07520 [Gammaproteobacteria bacterium]|nr:hypothetical protein [Gammaproteobacteria bacterium]